jgi:hypothetical protein
VSLKRAVGLENAWRGMEMCCNGSEGSTAVENTFKRVVDP